MAWAGKNAMRLSLLALAGRHPGKPQARAPIANALAFSSRHP
jgi:hypothetical protein